MEKSERYLQRIKRLYPDLRVVTARLNEGGQSNDGLIINEEFIFRFPKLNKALNQLHVEYAILRGIQDRVSLAVPNPTHSDLSVRSMGEAFIGYRLIPGEPLWRETYLALEDDASRRHIAGQLALFLKQLHQVPLEAIDAELPRRDTHAEWVSLYARIRKKLLPHLDPVAELRVRRDFSTFLAEPEHFAYTPRLRHGDFGTVNLLFDSRAQSVSGVIDFGNAGLGDPALDFAALIAPFSYGEEVLEEMADLYPLPEPALRRARFYVRTFALQEALYGLEHANQEAFDAGMRAYR